MIDRKMTLDVNSQSSSVTAFGLGEIMVLAVKSLLQPLDSFLTKGVAAMLEHPRWYHRHPPNYKLSEIRQTRRMRNHILRTGHLR